MAHWRDGGIGNMAGSDDRPIEEWTLLEKLAEIATTPFGAAIPKCLQAPTERIGEQVPLPDGGSIGLAVNDWSVPLRAIAQEAFDEISQHRPGEAVMNVRPNLCLEEIQAMLRAQPLTERLEGFARECESADLPHAAADIREAIELLRGLAAQ